MILEKPEWLRGLSFRPIIEIPIGSYVHDFSNGEDPNPADSPYSIGKYNEVRNNMYTSEQYVREQRNIHMGVDIAAPVDEPIYSFYQGKILFLGNNSQEGNYGPTLVIEYQFNQDFLYALYGHLSLESLSNKYPGDEVTPGQTLGWIGDETINGGWFPHLHFQISLKRPTGPDMPGVVAKLEHEQALKTYPDPRWVLGPIY